jgi:hypothetical protein
MNIIMTSMTSMTMTSMTMSSITMTSSTSSMSSTSTSTSPISNKTRQIVEIISNIRESILNMLSENKEGDSWDEEEHGVAWIDNEICFAIDFLRVINPTRVYPDLCDVCNSIPDVQQKMEEMTTEEIRLIHFFIFDLCGSDCDDMIISSKEEALKWIQEKGFEFKVKMCHVCKKEDIKMKKCAGCMSIRYCSEECQKKDWKSHSMGCKEMQKEIQKEKKNKK